MKQNKQQLRNSLNRLDGKSYKLYKDIKGECRFDHFTVFVDHVQGDPFASPSRIRVQLSQQISQFPVDIFHNRSRSVALRDFLERSSVVINDNFLEVRFLMGLPAFGWRIAGQHAIALFIGQTRAIADAIYYATRYMNENRTLKEIAMMVLADLREKGFEVLDRIPSGEYAAFRKYEFIGAVNRLRSIRMRTIVKGEG